MQEINWQGYQSTSTYRKMAIFLLLCTLLALKAEATTLFRVTLLNEDFFQKIYKVNHNTRQYFLMVSCKEKNMLSISVSQKKEFQQAPRFNIYGDSQDKPKMGQYNYTFLKECHALVEVNNSDLLVIKRSKDSAAIFSLTNITFRNLHNTFRVKDNSTKWGLGQRFQAKFRVTDGKWTIWNRDKPWKIDRGAQDLSDQTYGHQPVYLARQRQNKLYHLTYFKNTNGMLLQISKDGDQLLFNSVGGNIHFIILLGQQDPQQVLQRYHEFIGRGHIPPFWSMGYHQCRWGYKSTDELNQVLTKFKNNDLPIDTIWSDLDYMNQKMIFTVNPFTHQGLNEMMKRHEIHFVPLVDVGVSTKDSVAMQKGKQLGIFLRSPQQTNAYYVGEVWPGQVHFVDYLHPKASTFWKAQMNRLYDQVKFSGVWLDMNQPSNFRGNEPTSQPFLIQQNEGINQMTINVDIPHYSTHKDQLYHREVHAYYGHLSAVATHQFLKERGQRPFIISRSNSVGTGHFAGHWTGDNVADWQFLRLSISGNFLFQIFGIQMVGSDICGFHQNTTEQLCSRWMQLGSFYPFARNHNQDRPRSQQPYSFGQKLLQTSRLSLKTRYALLKQLFTIMVMKQGKGSFFRPIGFEFYQDENAFEQQFIETQFLIGKGLMVTPIVYQKSQSRQVYFPSVNQMWYSFKIDTKTGKIVFSQTVQFEGGTKAKISNTLPSAPPIFLRGGYAVLTNKPTNRASGLNSQFHLFAGLKEGKSFSQMLAIEDYNDQDHLSQCIQKGCFMYLSLKKGQNNSFTLSWNYQGNKDIKGKIKVLSIAAIQDNQRWSHEKIIQLSTIKGDFTFKANKL